MRYVQEIATSNSIEQSSYIRHRPKQLHRLIRKWQKTLPFIEATGTFIFRIHDHRERRNLATGRPVECIAQEKPPVTFSLATPIHCEPSQKRRRDQRISWQIPHRLRRQLGELHRRRGERVVARDRPIRQDQDERRGHVLPCVLSCLCPKISVERLNPALELRSVMARSQRLDAELFFDTARHASDAGSLAITADRLTKAIIDRLRVEQRINERLAVTQ